MITQEDTRKIIKQSKKIDQPTNKVSREGDLREFLEKLREPSGRGMTQMIQSKLFFFLAKKAFSGSDFRSGIAIHLARKKLM